MIAITKPPMLSQWLHDDMQKRYSHILKIILWENQTIVHNIKNMQHNNKDINLMTDAHRHPSPGITKTWNSDKNINGWINWPTDIVYKVSRKCSAEVVSHPHPDTSPLFNYLVSRRHPKPLSVCICVCEDVSINSQVICPILCRAVI